MVSKKIVGILVCAVMLYCASFVWAGIPDPDNSYADVPQDPTTVSCVVCPLGDGDAYTQCYLLGGTQVNSVIELWVRDINDDPVYLYPASDLWVVFTGINECPVHACIADAPTAANGYTTFSGPFYGSGCDDTNSTNISLNGIVLNHPGKPIWHNSPDMSGDLLVNLTDVVLFAPVYYGAYDYCADFYWDGVVNLSDLVILAQHMNHACP